MHLNYVDNCNDNNESKKHCNNGIVDNNESIDDGFQDIWSMSTDCHIFK